MKNECGNRHVTPMGIHYYCDRIPGHSGHHVKHTVMGLPEYMWAKTDKAPFKVQFYDCKTNEKVYDVQFTVQELAELYGILAGNHDIPEVYLNKVGKALKAAL